MKTLVLVTIFILCQVKVPMAQSGSQATRKPYQTWITPVKVAHPRHGRVPPERDRVTGGYLFEVRDSSLLLSNKSTLKDMDPGKFKISTINAGSISKIELRKKNNQVTGIMIGWAAGASLGVVIGFAVHNPDLDIWHGFGNDLLTFFLPILSTGLGIAVGAGIGGAKITIPIGGNQEQFEDQRTMLAQYAIGQNSEFHSKTFSKLRDTLVDIDGNVYHTIVLGGQVWMAEDLRVSRFRDSTEISKAAGSDPGAFRLYDWQAVHDSRTLCPGGWHVPSRAEWISLYNSLGGENIAARKLSESFSGNGKVCHWWSSTEQDAGLAQSFYLDMKTNTVIFTATDKNSSLSVRCIRD